MENSLSRYKSSLYSIVKIALATVFGIWLAGVVSNTLFEISLNNPGLARVPLEIVLGFIAIVIGSVISVRTVKSLLKDRWTFSVILVDLIGASLLTFGVMLALYGLTSMGI